MANTISSLPADSVLLPAILKRIALDLEMMLGRELIYEGQRFERARTRPAGSGRVHISFKLALGHEGAPPRHGAFLLPLPEAITMACFLLMIPEEIVAQRREETSLDATLKDAMLEIGNMIGGASNTALTELGLAGWSARSEGCQGVRADVRPAFPYEEGSELMVAHLRTRLEPFEAFDSLLILPTFA